MSLTLLLIGVNFVLRQCIHVWASLSGTHTAACSVAGLLLPVWSKMFKYKKTRDGIMAK